MSTLGIKSFQLRNFKAVRDSSVIKFNPLTVFIGNNGSGKSSIIEGLETLQMIATGGVNNAMLRWGGFEHIWNKAVSHKLQQNKKLDATSRPYYSNPMDFDLQGTLEKRMNIKISMEITRGAKGDEIFIRKESLSQKGRNVPSFTFERDSFGNVTGMYTLDGIDRSVDIPNLVDNTSLLNLKIPGFPYDTPLKNFISNWQFLTLNPQSMGERRLLSRTGARSRLEKDGSNLAEYLFDIQRMNREIFEGVVETVRYILPYSQDLQVELASEIVREVYLQLTEETFKVPGWLLSTGTLRIVALLALLRHPEPPPVILIEEIENGLDPDSINLVVDEIRNAVEDGRTQVIMTTHSPYLLDLLSLDHIILVERINGLPVFTRPGDNEELQEWTKRFRLGQLYVTNKLGKGGQR